MPLDVPVLKVIDKIEVTNEIPRQTNKAAL